MHSWIWDVCLPKTKGDRMGKIQELECLGDLVPPNFACRPNVFCELNLFWYTCSIFFSCCDGDILIHPGRGLDLKEATSTSAGAGPGPEATNEKKRLWGWKTTFLLNISNSKCPIYGGQNGPVQPEFQVYKKWWFLCSRNWSHSSKDRGSHPAFCGAGLQGTHEKSWGTIETRDVGWLQIHCCPYMRHGSQLSLQRYLCISHANSPMFGPILTSRNALKDALKGPEAQSEELVSWFSGRNWYLH